MEKNINEQIGWDNNDLEAWIDDENNLKGAHQDSNEKKKIIEMKPENIDAWIDDNKTYPDKEIQRILKKII